MKKYKCQRCGKVFEALNYKFDNTVACPYCPGVGIEWNGMKYTKEMAENELNEIGCPHHEHPETGGRVSWASVNTYGTWLRRNDPTAFEVYFQENKRS